MNNIVLLKLEKLGIDTSSARKVDSKGFSRSICPRCDEVKKQRTNAKDLAYKQDTGFYFCHKCNWKGNVLFTKEVVYQRPVFIQHQESDKVLSYLNSRGISNATIKKLIDLKLIAYSKNDNKFVFTYYRGDEFINFKTRTIDGSKDFSQQVDGEKILYNINSVKGKEEVIIVEGEMSALACIEAGLDSKYGIVSLENGAQKEGVIDGKFQGLKNCYEELKNVKRFIIALDNDQAGTYTASKLISYLGEANCNLVEYPVGCKDPDDIINRNLRPSYTSFENNKILADMIINSIEFPVSGIVSLSPKLKELLLQYKKHGRPKATPLPIPVFTEYFSFLRGQLTIVTGYANMGKSTLANYLAMVTALSFNWKWGIFAAEQHPVDKYFEDIAAMILKKNIQGTDRYGNPLENVASDEEVAEAYDFIENHFYLIYPNDDTCDTKWLLEKMAYLKDKHNINGFILDTFNKLDHDFGYERDDVYMGKWMNKILKECRQYDAFMVVMHPPKPTRTKSGSYAPPDMYDIAHGAQVPNKADNIVVMHRQARFGDSPAPPNAAEIYIRKLRDAEATGKIGRIDCEWDTDDHTYFFGTSMAMFNMTLDDYYRRAVQDVFEYYKEDSKEDICPF